jgi:hypothetical protein
MKDQLISYETAVLASELGFKGPIGLGVEYNLGQYYNNKGVLNGSCTDGIFQTINHHMALERGDTPEPVSSKVVAAPTQSLLQKWIRETHDIHVIPTINPYSEDTNLYGWKIYAMDIIGLRCVKSDEITILSYEEALEKGLFEALKLIKK